MSPTSYTAPAATEEQPAATTVAVNDSLAPSESLAPNESLVTPSAPITVEQQRLSNDERIQQAVMDKLASNTSLYGNIGVESKDAVVRLSGYTTTRGMAWRAARDATSVVGVKYVQNEIRPRVGGSV